MSSLTIDASLRTAPRPWQVSAMNRAAELLRAGEPGAALLMEQGTGKTLATLGLVSALARKGSADWALVVSPKVLAGEWIEQIREHWDGPGVHLRTLDGPLTRRAHALHDDMQHARGFGGLLLAFLNVDYFSRGMFVKVGRKYEPSDRLHELRGVVEASPPGVLIVDESSLVKTPTAFRSGALRWLARAFRFRFILTGTPVTQGPLDVWSQFEILKPGALGYTDFGAFRERYAVLRLQATPGGRRRYWDVVGYQNLDELRERVAALSFSCRADECDELPPVTERRLRVPLSAEQARHIRQLGSEMVVELDDGGTIDGRNILSRYGKMRQIIGGHVYTSDEDGEPTGEVEHYSPNPKLAALREYLDVALDDETAKAVVFCEYRAEIDAIVDALGAAAVPLHGGVNDAQRAVNIDSFKTPGGPGRVLVVQYQTGAYGLNLTAANHLIFYSITFSLEHWLQARKRVHRMGQQRHVNEVVLVAQGRNGGRTLDDEILTALDAKKFFADTVVGDPAGQAEQIRRVAGL